MICSMGIFYIFGLYHKSSSFLLFALARVILGHFPCRLVRQLSQDVLYIFSMPFLPVFFFQFGDHAEKVALIALLLALFAQVFECFHSYIGVIGFVVKYYLVWGFGLIWIPFGDAGPGLRQSLIFLKFLLDYLPLFSLFMAFIDLSYNLKLELFSQILIIPPCLGFLVENPLIEVH